MVGDIAVVSLGARATANEPVKGCFANIRWIELPDRGPPNMLRTWIEAVELARRHEAGWTVILSPGEALTHDAFELAGPALRLYDAVFGSVRETGSESVARLSRLAFDQPERLPHALLNWWMPDAHIVKTDIAADVLRRIERKGNESWRLDYLFDLWSSARCLKSAQPMLSFAGSPQPLEEQARREVLARLEVDPVFLPIVHGDATYDMPYTGLNAGIEREQSRGLFFEAMELEELRKVVPPGATILDVGANTGNHTVFFAGPMKAGRVIPFEPLPIAIKALRAAVARNHLENVDLSWLGTGVADHKARATLAFSGRGGLGATSLVPDPEGEIGIASLDSMLSERIDLLKIDVEGMEMNVLAGAAGLIRASRPMIFVEVANRNTSALLDWLERMDYRIMRIFTDKGHANYLLAPGVAP